MAGVFTHLAVVRSIYADNDRFSAIAELTPEIKFALRFRSEFVDLGSVSPDCPYFRLGDPDEEAASWAEVMHYWRTGDFVREAITWLRGKNHTEKDIQKAIAWLFGYTAHLVTDLTVHPVVGLRVGEYAENQSEHRVCELQQDAYMFYRTLGIDATAANYLKGPGLKSCTNESDNKLHSKVAELWKHCASTIKPSPGDADYVFSRTPNKPPQPETWFKWFCEMIDKGAENGYQIPILSYFLLKYGLALPKNQNAVNMSYVSGLTTPDGGKVNFPEIFEKAIDNTMKYWGELAVALRTESPESFSLANANLDNGKAYETGTLVFWDKSYIV